MKRICVYCGSGLVFLQKNFHIKALVNYILLYSMHVLALIFIFVRVWQVEWIN